MTDDERQAIVDAGYKLKQAVSSLPILSGTNEALLAELATCQSYLGDLALAIRTAQGMPEIPPFLGGTEAPIVFYSGEIVHRDDGALVRKEK